MAVVVAGTEASRIPRRAAREGPGPAARGHIRPDASDEATRAAAVDAFAQIVQPCAAQGRDGALSKIGSPDGGEPQFCLVTLLRSEGQLVAAAAVIARCRDQERARQRLQSMQLVAGYFELYSLRRAADRATAVAQSQQNILQIAAAFAAGEGFESAAMNLCNELATRAGLPASQSDGLRATASRSRPSRIQKNSIASRSWSSAWNVSWKNALTRRSPFASIATVAAPTT